jgi:hypothetical protein
MTTIKKSINHFLSDVWNVEEKCNDHARQWMATYKSDKERMPRYTR